VLRSAVLRSAVLRSAIRRAALALVLAVLAPIAGAQDATGPRAGAAEVADDPSDGRPGATPLERSYSERAGATLRLVGHRPFRNAEGSPTPAAAPVGVVDDDYRLGPGDRLTVTYHGARTATETVAVHSDGALVLPDGPPVPAAGRRLGDLRAAVARTVAEIFTATDVSVSLAAARQRTVTVAGEVGRPGRHRLGAFSTVIDALFAAGGPTARGSLRSIRLVRDGAVRRLDLAELAAGGAAAAADLPLADGDRLVVPPLGPTAAVAGAVGRPGIHELPRDGATTTAGDLLSLAGGRLPGAGRVLRFGWTPDGRPVAGTVEPPYDAPLADGDLLVVRFPEGGARRATVAVEGAVAAPGLYPAEEAGRAGSAIAAAGRLAATAYRPFAAVIADGQASDGPAPRAIALPPSGPVPIDAGPSLNPGDRLVILSRRDVAFLSSAAVRRALTGDAGPRSSTPPADGGTAPVAARRCPALDALADAGPRGGLAAPARLARLAPARGTGPEAEAAAPCPAAFAERPALLGLALEHAVLLLGGVTSPGLFPVARPVAPADLLAAAGLPAPHAAQARTLSGRDGRVRPGDVIDAGAPQVDLAGPVEAPGTQPLAAAPTVGALLADGARLTADAYPLVGVIDGRDPVSGAMRHRLFAPMAPPDAGPVALRRGDRVRLFDRTLMRAWAAGELDAGVQTVRPAAGPAAAQTSRPPADPAGEAGLPRIVADDTHDPAGRPGTDVGSAPPAPAPPLPAGLSPTTRAALAAATVRVEGAVAHPGAYPVAGPTTLDRLIDAAGGFAGDADRTAAEVRYVEPVPGGGPRSRRTVADLGVTPPETLRLAPGDAVRIPVRADAGPPAEATILGAVRRPGSYPLLHGERLSDLIRRAGGLQEDAFTLGAVLTRRDAAARQRQAFGNAATAIETALADRLAGAEPPDPEVVDRARALAARLRAADPPGRVVVEADPAVLRTEPALDPVLIDGDVIRYPVRPHSVAVTGAVLAPGALQYRPGKTVADYLDEAGGLARDADDGRIFVLHPDGRAQPVRGSVWRHTPTMLAAGSTVVVPRDTRTLDTLGILEAVGRVVGQVAIGTSAILSLAVDE